MGSTGLERNDVNSLNNKELRTSTDSGAAESGALSQLSPKNEINLTKCLSILSQKLGLSQIELILKLAGFLSRQEQEIFLARLNDMKNDEKEIEIPGEPVKEQT